MHGRDVGVGEESEHAKKLVRADPLREAADRFRIKDVAPKGGRHIEVAFDKTQDEAAFVDTEFEAGADGGSQFAARRGVIGRDAAFAGVMQKCGQKEQVGVGKLPQDAAEADPPLRCPGRRLGGERVQHVDEDEGVFVNGVAVVGVADDEGVDAVELGEDELEHTQGMELPKSVAGVGADQDGAQPGPQARALFERAGEEGDGGGDAFFAPKAECDAGGGDHTKGGEDNFGLMGGVEGRRGVRVPDGLG